VDLEKIMYDYIRWMFDLDFCTPRYNIKETGFVENERGVGLKSK